MYSLNVSPPISVQSVVVDDDGTSIALVGVDGRQLVVSVYGDCCSESYFEANSVADAKELVGATVTRLEKSDSSKEEVECIPTNPNSQDNDWARYYCLKLTTDRGVVTLDCRNESNGFYRGEFDWRIEPTTPSR